MPAGPITAHDGVRALAKMRSAGVLGVDEFEKACKRTGAPHKVAVPQRALDALVCANIDHFATDRWYIAVARAVGAPFCGHILAARAIRCDVLRRVYVRINARRPRSLRPCAVTPIVRAALATILRERIAAEPSAIVPRIDPELRRSAIGVLSMPTPAAAIRRACRVTVAVAAVAWFVRVLARGGNAVAAQSAIVVVVGMWVCAFVAIAREHTRADSRSPRTEATAYLIALGILLW